MLKPGVCSESISAILNDGVEDGLLSKSDDWELGEFKFYLPIDE